MEEEDMEEEDMEEEDETEWGKSLVESAPASPAAAAAAAAAAGSDLAKAPHTPAHKVILHFDLDCFYAQVEMIRNPALRDVPLGIQQKYIIVTCNYVARELGVTKLMSVSDAKEKCPQLVLVKGEDLTHYREMSYKVTELLMSFCPLVERLGFDENYMDVTEMVERRLAQTPDSDYSFQGHVYNGVAVEAGGHLRLAVGSHIAAELRGAISSKLGLTGCAGIATNKLLAKLVSGTFKPNQQTTLLPGNVGDIMGGLSSLRKVPGVGHQTAKRLQALGLVSVKDLQVFPLADLVREFGGPSAHRLKNLSLGIDGSPVSPTGAPQSLSDEDSFKKMSSTKDVIEKIQQLAGSLVERMRQDGRQPHTFRLTIRRYSATNKWFSRESRQCPIAGNIGQKITSGCSDEAVALLLPVAMKLFHKMVDASAAFHLTLINVGFSNLQTRGPAAGGRGSITSFFAPGTSPRKTQDGSAPSGDNHRVDHQFSTHGVITPTTESPRSSEAALRGFKRKQCVSVLVQSPQPRKVSRSSMRSESEEQNNTVTPRLPPNVDPDVFRLLPEDIQKELLSFAGGNAPPTDGSASPVAVADSEASASSSLCPPPPKCQTPSFPDSQNLPPEEPVGASTVNLQCRPATSAFLREHVRDEARPSSDYHFPVDVDPEVFSELPADVQEELVSEWKRQRAAARKPQRASMTKDKKAAGKSSQANNLFNYFKPN